MKNMELKVKDILIKHASRLLKALALMIFITASPLNAASANEWTTYDSRNEMTDRIFAQASSPRVSATRTLPFPYNDLKARIVYQCSETGAEGTAVQFDSDPNLTDTETTQEYTEFKVRIRWDDDLRSQPMRHSIGDREVYFVRYDKNGLSDPLRKLQEHDNVLIEFDIFSAGKAIFKFGLQGSASAITEAQTLCGISS